MPSNNENDHELWGQMTSTRSKTTPDQLAKLVYYVSSWCSCLICPRSKKLADVTKPSGQKDNKYSREDSSVWQNLQGLSWIFPEARKLWVEYQNKKIGK